MQRGRSIKGQGRQLLAKMSSSERCSWFGKHQAELEEFSTYLQGYLKRRARHGYYTRTDERYQQFLEMAADLIMGLAEMRKLTAQAQVEGVSQDEGQEE